MALIEFDNVDLIYPVRQDHRSTLKEFLLKGFLRREPGRIKSVHALQKISFRVEEGEKIGIIGYNGAGKSTLLRTIAGVFPVAAGVRRVDGCTRALFDVGVGFETEATGWQNIYYRGYLQGETPSSLKSKVDDIARFSELGEFLDLPLRCYSTGMILRLAFSIATSSEPEILLMDEFFATGDVAFQRKAEQRMREFLHRAKIVVLVSHNLPFLEEFCSRILWLHQGQIVADGPAKQVIAAYLQNAEQRRAAA